MASVFSARVVRAVAASAPSILRRSIVTIARLHHLPRVAAVATPRSSMMPMQARTLFIRVESTPNPDSMKFVPENKTVLPEKFGNGIHFTNAAEAKGAAFVRRLLKYKEVTGVFVGRDFVSVNKTEDSSWMALKPIVLDILMDAFADAEAKNIDVIEDVAPSDDTVITDEDDEVVAMIKELLEERIRPAVQEDGGDIIFKGFDAESGIVKLKMAGSCVGCPSSTATLRNGVENMLMHYIPEVKGIKQIKDELDELNDKEFAEVEAKASA